MKIAKPLVGLVVKYGYLWHHEAHKGLDGGKDRPCAIILATEDGIVMVVPITTKQPTDMSMAVEIPDKAAAMIGLKGVQSWAICTEVNQFVWPGPDLQKLAPDNDTCVYGMLPRSVVLQIMARLKFLARGRTFKVIRRAE